MIELVAYAIVFMIVGIQVLVYILLLMKPESVLGWFNLGENSKRPTRILRRGYRFSGSRKLNLNPRTAAFLIRSVASLAMVLSIPAYVALFWIAFFVAKGIHLATETEVFHHSTFTIQ